MSAARGSPVVPGWAGNLESVPRPGASGAGIAWRHLPDPDGGTAAKISCA